LSTNFVVPYQISIEEANLLAVFAAISAIEVEAAATAASTGIGICAAADPNAGNYNRKRRGEIAELICAVAAMKHGFSAARPYGDSDPFDVIVMTRKVGRARKRKVSTVQVRAIYKPIYIHEIYMTYQVTLSHGKNYTQQFKPGDYDVLAIYIAPHNSWYILPARAIHGRKVLHLYPHRPNRGGWEEQYRERWDLFK
jgi:hypothetical protein